MSPTKNAPFNIGIDVSTALTAEDAVVMAGLDWEVDTHETFYKGGNDEDFNLVKSKKFRSIVRSDTGEEFGHPTKRYTPVQNIDAFKWLNGLTDEGVRFHRAGSFRGGRKTFMIVLLPWEDSVNGDEVQRAMIVSTSHDSTTGVRANWLPIRVECANVIAVALATAPFTFRHTVSVKEGITPEKGREVLFNAEQYFSTYRQALNTLESEPFNDEEMFSFIEHVFESPRRSEDAVRRSNDYLYDTLLQLFRNGRGTFGSSRWDAFNAICEYVDYDRPVGNTFATAGNNAPAVVNERHYNSVLSTNRYGGVKLRTKAFSYLMEGLNGA